MVKIKRKEIIAKTTGSIKSKAKKLTASLRSNGTSNSIHDIVKAGKDKGYSVQIGKDFGAGPIDAVWNINLHSALSPLRCGFISLKEEEQVGPGDLEDRQFSLRKIEEAVVRGIRSGMDKVYLLCDTEYIAKSVTGRIEWLSSFGSLLRFDTYSTGLFPSQKSLTRIIPSQRRVPEGEKIRKKNIKERERKFEKYNRPPIEKRRGESVSHKLRREISINEYSKPKGQKKRF